MLDPTGLSFLAVSGVGLLAGPLVYRMTRGGQPQWHAALDAFALVSVCGLATLHLLPEAVLHGGWVAIGLAILGMVGPVMAQRWWGHRSLAALLVAFGVHVMIESAGLSGAAGLGEGPGLGVAVISHRVPLGLVLYGAVASHRGERAAMVMLVVIMGAMVTGFMAGEAAHRLMAPVHHAWLQALIAGSLMHVAWSHRHDGDSDHALEARPQTHGWAAVGGVLGVMVVVLSLSGESSHVHGGDSPVALFDALEALAVESAPALLLGYLLAGWVGGALRPSTVEFLAERSSAVRALLSGVPRPAHAVDVRTLYAAIIRRGASAWAALAFLVATPALGIDAVVLSLSLLGGVLTLLRVVGAVVVALVVAWLMARFGWVTHHCHIDDDAMNVKWPQQAQRGLRFGFVTLFDRTMPWMLAGLAVAAVTEPLVEHGLLNEVSNAIEVPVAALLSVPIYVCTLGATPLVAIAVHKGVSLGAAVAFLLAGPATNREILRVVDRYHGRRATIVFVIAVLGCASLIGWGIEGIDPVVIHEVDPHHYGPVTWYEHLSIAILAGLIVASWVRQGPRGFLDQLLGRGQPIEDDPEVTRS